MPAAWGDEEARPLTAEPDALRDEIRRFRSDCWPWCVDGLTHWWRRARHAQAWLLSVPLVARVRVAAERAAFLYDYASDALVAKALAESGNPMWRSVVVAVMILPYVLMVIALRDSVPRRLAAQMGCSPGPWRVAWPVLGPFVCLGADVALHVYYAAAEPKGAAFHYMTLRQVTELLEATLQCLFQGYIAARLANPGGLLPEVHAASVNPWLLGTSLAFSANGVRGAWGKLVLYARYHTGGDRQAFLRKMMDLGDGLAPSHLFSELRTQRAVTVDVPWADINGAELQQLARAARASPVLEELWLVDVAWGAAAAKHDRSAIESALEDFLTNRGLRRFEIRGAEMPAWTVEGVRAAVGWHPSLEDIKVEGAGSRFTNDFRHLVLGSPLLQAASSGDIAAIERLPQEGVGIEALALAQAGGRDSLPSVRALLLRPGGLEAIHGVVRHKGSHGWHHPVFGVVCESAGAAVVELLLLARADLEKATENGATPICLASWENNCGALAQLLAARANPDKATEDGTTAISGASQSNNSEALAQLLAARANPDKAKEDGATPIFAASQSNSSESLAQLLAARADPEKANKNGATPVYIASQENSSEALSQLLAARADPDKAKKDAWTPVLIASHKNGSGALARLLAARADPDKAHTSGATPIYLASQSNSSEALAQLLAARANPDKAMEDGATPICIASYHNNSEALAQLLAARADPDKAMEDGSTPIYVASKRNSNGALGQLLAARADPEIAISFGRTPMWIASKNNNSEAVAQLLAARASPDKAKGKGARPIGIASHSKNSEALAQLIAAGADQEKALETGATLQSSSRSSSKASPQADPQKAAEHGATSVCNAPCSSSREASARAPAAGAARGASARAGGRRAAGALRQVARNWFARRSPRGGGAPSTL